ncbi:MAG: DUF1206 domain-containing protein [Gammaproteobacteria bacterium]|nr:MAG: DUF1206 domain-containing protein [Gammaproteobacteria bacterium]
MGYAARGSVYLVIGGLAILAALGEGGKTTDSKGAIVEILHQPFGTVLLVLLIVGLVGYVLWRLVQSIQDTDSHGTSAKGLVVRAGLMASAVSHGFLALWTLKLLLGRNDTPQNTERFLSTGVGHVFIGLAGIAFVGAGFAHIFKGWTARFERYMDIPADKDVWVRPLCRFGLIARGIVWCIIGWFFIRSAIFAKSGKVEGMAEALELLRANSYGVWLFGIVAAGLFAFGAYSLLEAVYRRIDLTPSDPFGQKPDAASDQRASFNRANRTNKYGS